MKTDEEIEKFESLLDDHYQWPNEYTFKFIVPKVKEQDLVAACFDGENISLRESANGRYVSVSSRRLVTSSSEVVKVYRKASTIPGVISL